ncbi:MAG: glycosyltransferase [Oculatellaceae cyanobacterium Prado106]|jgi:MGT family glycosyltransferase|nr:glycosyltransferase [Oculatellaceae cyanobacterium Prado106]
MARFLIATIPVVGHVSPAKPIARQLIDRGHQVWWYTGGAFQASVESTGAHFVPIRSGLDYSFPENVPKAAVQPRDALRGLAQLKFDLKYFFIESAIAQVADLRQILQEFPADVILADFCFLGAAWLHEQGGPPWAGFGVSVLALSSQDTPPFGLGLLPNASLWGRFRDRSLYWLIQRLFRDLLADTNQIRAQMGLPATTQGFFDTLSPFLHLAGTVPAFEYPRRDLPPQVHFIGPLLASVTDEFTPPPWWADLQTDKPIILVTQGTVATNPADLIAPTLQALAQEDVLVVATMGGVPIDRIQLNPIPANARIASFIPFSHLLPSVDVMVTNGGYNGVQMALAQGVPLIVSGQTEDKPEVAARVEWAGVGIRLKPNKLTPDRLKTAVRQILTDPQYKARAKQLQAIIAGYDAPVRAVELLEQLAATQQPINSGRSTV